MSWLFGNSYYYRNAGTDSDDEQDPTLRPQRPVARDSEGDGNRDDEHVDGQEVQEPAPKRHALTEVLGKAAELLPSVVKSWREENKENEDLDEAAKAAKGMCIECTDQPAIVFCEQCQDDFCEVCFAAQHRRGMRSKHTYKKIATQSAAASSSAEVKQESVPKPTPQSAEVDDDDEKFPAPFPAQSATESAATSSVSKPSDAGPSSSDAEMEPEDRDASAAEAAPSPSPPLPAIENIHHSNTFNTLDFSSRDSPVTNSSIVNPDWFVERSQYIPLRLSLEERKLLRLAEATINVSDYTDKIDIISYKDKKKRIFAQLKDVCAILSGLVVASDYNLGQSMIKDKDFKDNMVFFQRAFEIARRHKIRNPEKMRSAYGKLLYLLQDSQIPEIQELMEFRCVSPLRTVHAFLKERNALALLRDPRLAVATGEINTEGKVRAQIDRELKAKDRAVKEICHIYSAQLGLSDDEIRACIGSIGDNHNFLRMNRDSCDKMIEYLLKYFRPDAYKQTYSLAICQGRSGARLTHSHETQYYYVLQSLLLWREILHDMFRLWYLAEEDLLDEENPYRLRDTGQGLNRVQSAPRVGRALHNIIHNVQKRVGFWVGSSVVHLGDHNVPNALMFIDKYNQVSRILNPIVITLRYIDKLCEKPDLRKYIEDTFGSAEMCRLEILTDFFRHAFDGSGADNFFDAGSCIDGRLTSAWHWCSLIEKKPFYPVFQLSGFAGFDGEFN